MTDGQILAQAWFRGLPRRTQRAIQATCVQMCARNRWQYMTVDALLSDLQDKYGAGYLHSLLAECIVSR